MGFDFDCQTCSLAGQTRQEDFFQAMFGFIKKADGKLTWFFHCDLLGMIAIHVEFSIRNP